MSADRRVIVILFAIALGARVLFGIFAVELNVGPDVVTREFLYAQKIASGFEWITTPYSPQSPGYPVVLAILHLVAIKQIWGTFFLQAVLSALTVVLLFHAARPLVGRQLALLAALWFALNFHHMLYTSLLYRDVLAVMLLLLVVTIIAQPFKTMRFGAVAGLAYAALFHVSPQFLLMFPVFAILLFFKTHHRLLSVQYFFVFACVAALLSVPWTIRNYMVYEQPIPVSLEAARYFKPFKLFVTDPEVSVTSIQNRVATTSRTHRIENNTVEFWRVTRFRADQPSASPEGESRRVEPAWSLRHNLISIASYGLLIPFLLVGAVAAVRRRERGAAIIFVVILTYFLMRAYLGGSERARLLADPLIILLAFYGFSVVMQWFRGRRQHGEQPAQTSAG
jgi:4-amino-4-deoxy-L-arabinose transferase-like glycosyltransferase